MEFRIYLGEGDVFKSPQEVIIRYAKNVFDAFETLTNFQKSKVEFITTDEDVFTINYILNPSDYVGELPF
jgi:hypothetical protein